MAARRAQSIIMASLLQDSLARPAWHGGANARKAQISPTAELKDMCFHPWRATCMHGWFNCALINELCSELAVRRLAQRHATCVMRNC